VHLQLVRDEKKYLGCLTRLNKMYMLPLTVPPPKSPSLALSVSAYCLLLWCPTCFLCQADPKLKGKIQPDELAAMFGNIKPLTTFHTNLLKQLESVEAKYELHTLFLFLIIIIVIIGPWSNIIIIIYYLLGFSHRHHNREVSAVFLHNLQELESVYTSYLVQQTQVPRQPHTTCVLLFVS
jgi:hypothetical protein